MYVSAWSTVFFSSHLFCKMHVYLHAFPSTLVITFVGGFSPYMQNKAWTKLKNDPDVF